MNSKGKSAELITREIRRKAFIAATATRLIDAKLTGQDITVDCSAPYQGKHGKDTLSIHIHPDIHGFWFGAMTVYQYQDALRVLTMLWDGAHSAE